MKPWIEIAGTRIVAAHIVAWHVTESPVRFASSKKPALLTTIYVVGSDDPIVFEGDHDSKVKAAFGGSVGAVRKHK